MELLLKGLSDRQAEAVTAQESQLCVLAGAGSGKTRVLTRRLAWLAESERIDPSHALVLTFTRKAANELGERLRSLGLDAEVAAGTFHSVAYAQLRARWADRDIKPPRLVDRRIGLFSETLPEADRDTLRHALGEFDWARARLISPGDYPSTGRRSPIDAERLAEAFVAFTELKKRRRVVDFDDLLSLAWRDLQADNNYAKAIAWRFRHLFVDEFQDLNPLQEALLNAWRGDDLCVVGDPDQAIYGWNGADASFLLRFAKAPEVRTIELNTNYRSAPAIVAVANRMLNPRRELPAVSRAGGADPVLTGHPDEQAEAVAVARAIRDSHAPGSSWSAQAVLMRTNVQATAIQKALAAAGIPYRVRGGRGFVDHPAVTASTTMLRQSSRRLRDTIPDLRELEVDGTDAGEHIDVVIRLARDQVRIDRETTAAAFADLLGSAAESETVGPSSDAVDLATFHSAKGLEWSVVHLVGLENGYVPAWQATGPAAVKEERRLLYVAMTRARNQLTMHWARKRTFGDHTVERLRSPFLRVFDEHQTEPLVEPDPNVRTSMRLRRQGLDTSEPFHDAQSALHATLLGWRADQARASGVEPVAVLSNAVLEQIAAQRPTTVDELTTIDGLSPVRSQRYGETLLGLVDGTGLE